MNRTWILCLLLAAPARATTTVVSVTFGGGWRSQQLALPHLERNGFKGTFYFYTEGIGLGGYFTPDEVRQLAARGHEVGSLGLSHADLPTLSVSSMTREACDSRAYLQNLGISPVVSFDYPYGHSDSVVESVVRGCGYSSARRSYGLSCSFTGCATAESIPPDDPYFIRVPPVVTSTTALGEIKRWVTDAENSGGGWVPLAFLSVCDGCQTWSITEADFSALMDWLADRSSRGTVVRTVGEVISGNIQQNPPPPPPPAPPAPLPSPVAVDFSQTRVFPNPWRADRHAGAGVTIDGLPPSSEIRFFTLSGRWVRTVDAPAGRATWNLNDDAGRSVASGLYLYFVGAPGLERMRGTLIVVR